MAGIAGVQLRALIERIEKIEEDKRDLSADLKHVYAEAKSQGFDVKIMRLLIKERRMDKDDIAELEKLLEVYRSALAGWDKTPLGDFADAAQ